MLMSLLPVRRYTSMYLPFILYIFEIVIYLVHAYVSRKRFSSISYGNSALCRSQWPSGLRHEISSPAQTLGSWVWIPLEGWMFVYVYSVFMLFCVGSGLATGWSPVQGIVPTVFKTHDFRIKSEWEQARVPNSTRKKKEKKKGAMCIL
jgi:hypothetical protein